jgi:hypothetical protein
MSNKEMMFVAQEAAEIANTKGANYFGDEGELNNYLFENVMCLTTSDLDFNAVVSLAREYCDDSLVEMQYQESENKKYDQEYAYLEMVS